MKNDEILEEIFNLEREARTISARLSELKQICKEKGSFASRHYVCVVSESSRQCLAPLHEVEKVFGRYSLLDNGLIKTHVSTTVKVAAKSNHDFVGV